MKININKILMLNPKLISILQRVIIHSIIILVCFYIWRYASDDNNGWIDILWAMGLSANAFLSDDYTEWIFTITDVNHNFSIGKMGEDRFAPVLKDGKETNCRLYIWDAEEVKRLQEIGEEIHRKNNTIQK